jgi:hypothetical protein
MEAAAMKRNDGFTKLLAIGGTVLVWLPLLAPVLFAVLAYVARGILVFDYLMPAELAVVALGGAAAVAFVVLALLLSSQDAIPGTWMETLLFAALGIYALGLAVVGIGGALLIHDLFRPSSPPPRAA